MYRTMCVNAFILYDNFEIKSKYYLEILSWNKVEINRIFLLTQILSFKMSLLIGIYIAPSHLNLLEYRSSCIFY